MKRTKEESSQYYSGVADGLKRAKRYYIEQMFTNLKIAYDDQIEAEININQSCAIRIASEIKETPPKGTP